MTQLVVPSYLFLLIAFMAFSCSSPNAQQGQADADSSGVQKTKPEVSYATDSFDLTAERLPQSFNGHNIEHLYENAQKFRDEYNKDEFESTDQYQQRVADLIERPLLEELTGRDIYAVRVRPDTNLTEYNADDQTLTLRFMTDSCIFELREYDNSEYPSDCKVHVLEVSSESKDPEYYQGSNAFGATKTIEKTESNTLGILLGKRTTEFELCCAKKELLPEDIRRYKELLPEDIRWYNDWPSLDYLDHPGLILPLPPDQAREAKAEINMLLVFQPQPPLTEKATDYTSPTMDMPLDRTEHYRLVVGKVAQVIIYNYETGQIYEKYTTDFGRNIEKNLPI